MPLVLDERLFDPAFVFHNINQVIDNPVFQSHNHVQIAQPDIGVNQYNPLSHCCKTGPYVCGCSGLTYTAFP